MSATSKIEALRKTELFISTITLDRSDWTTNSDSIPTKTDGRFGG